MSIFDFEKPPEEDKSQPKADENTKPVFEPKRVIHRSKPVSPPGDGNRRPASIFRHKAASPPAAKNQADAAPAVQPETPAVTANPESTPLRGNQATPTRNDKGINPGQRLRTLVTGVENVLPPTLSDEARPISRGERTRRAFWDVSSGLSLLVNVILLGILLVMAFQIRSLKTTIDGLLGGLYNNFVEMDNASITTIIPVEGQVPVSFTLPIQRNTVVTLTSSVTIPDAYVVINTGILSISSKASVTLPIGTSLPIALDMEVPVQTTIPISLQVPVTIPLSQTQLDKPFTGLQNTVGPYYCIFQQDLADANGGLVCQHGTYIPKINAP